jgi:hypothetical protein
MRATSLIGIFAAAAAATTALAQGPVYSVNIVGFQKVASSNLFTQVSNPFRQEDSTIGGVVGDQLTGGFDFDSGDNIFTWNGSSYNRYFLAENTGLPEFDGKWLDENLEEATEELPPGKGFWIVNRNTNDTVVMVGDVVSDASIVTAIQPGFNMVSYPFSTSVAINSSNFNMNVTAGFTGGVDFDTADTIFIWNGSQYVRYFLVDVGVDPELDNKWVDENLEIVTASIDPGQGFWVRKLGANSVNWVVNKPY